MGTGGGVTLTVRSVKECFGTFKLPSTAELVVKRWQANCVYFAANYLIILLFAFLLYAGAGSRVALISAILVVFAHCTCKTRTISSKFRSFLSRRT